MPFVDVLKRYPEIELFSREQGYQLFEFITKKEKNQSPLTYLIALGIPVYSALNLAAKLMYDACRIIHTIIQSIKQREYAGGNIQTLIHQKQTSRASNCSIGRRLR